MERVILYLSSSARRTLQALVLLFFAVIIRLPLPVHSHNGTVLSALISTEPVIDGTLSPGEWSSAATSNITLGPYTGTIYVMNDLANLYIAIAVTDPTPGNDQVTVPFDNNHDGVWPDLSPGEDMISWGAPPQFYDLYESSAGTNTDVNDGGTTNGSGMAGMTATQSIFEFSHPLCSGDSHDFCLAQGQIVGFAVRYFHDGFLAGDWPAPVAHGTAASQWADITVARFTGLSAWATTTPLVDGKIGCRWTIVGHSLNRIPIIGRVCDEWADAAALNFTLVITTGNTTTNFPGTLYMKNDQTNLYAAVRIGDSDQEPSDLLRLFFDNNNNGLAENGDEYLHIGGDGVYYDRFYSSVCNCIVDDINSGGTRDGASLGGYDPVSRIWFFEFAHPLNSADGAHDFSLKIGAIVGLGIQYFEKGIYGGAGSVLSNLKYGVASSPTPLQPVTRDLRVTGFEVTQAAQCLDNLSSQATLCSTGALIASLVKNKRTVVRVYVNSGALGAPDTPVTVYLYGAQLATGQPITQAVGLGGLVASTVAKSTGGNRANIADTANFLLPPSWLTADTLILKAYVKGASPVYEPNYGNNWAVAPGPVLNPERQYRFSTTRNLDIYVIPINTGTAATPVLPPAATIQAQENYMATIFPFAQVNFETGTWQQVGVWTGGVGNALNQQLDLIWQQIAIARLFACAFGGPCLPIPDVVYGISNLSGGIAWVTWFGGGDGHAANGGVSAGGCPSPCPPLMSHETNHALDRSINHGETVTYDTNSNGVYDSGEPLIAGIFPAAGTVLKTDGKVRFVDANNNFVWDIGESVVYDNNNNGSYDSNEPVIAGATPITGTVLRTDGKIKYVNDDVYEIPDIWNQGTWGRHISGARARDPTGTTSYGCGAAGPDPSWPFTNGGINEYGLDTRTLTVLGPATSELMTYCWSPTQGGPPWISVYRWQSIFNTFDPPSSPGPQSPAILAPSGSSFLITGSINAGGSTGSIDSVLQMQGQISEPQATGRYSIVLLAADGTVLASKFFDAVFVDIDNNTLTTYRFNAVLPFSSTPNRIQLRLDNTVLSETVASANPPVVTVLSPKTNDLWPTGQPQTISWTASDLDGNPLTYTVQYSIDGGTTWLPLGNGLKESSYTVDPSLLLGSTKAVVRILASDGFYTTVANSGLFTIQDKPPVATIQSPSDMSQYNIGDPTILVGRATDPEDGVISPTSLSWFSSIDGFLGNGTMLMVQLSAGTHTITLKAMDLQGTQSATSIQLIVKVAGTDKLFVLDWADYDNNGKIDIVDVANAAFVFDKPSNYWDLNMNGKVDITDIATVAFYFDQVLAGPTYPGLGYPPGQMDKAWTKNCNILPQNYQLYCATRIPP